MGSDTVTMHNAGSAAPSAGRAGTGERVVVFDEDRLIPAALLRRVDPERLRRLGWLPLSAEGGAAVIAAVVPEDPAVAEDARRTLQVVSLDILGITPDDLARIIANSCDVNVGFPADAGRDALARVRTYLANRRSLLASRRTIFAKGRTGLAMVRTGLAFTTASLLLLKVFGLGWVTLLEAALLAAAIFLMADGLRWYLPARRLSSRRLTSGLPPQGEGTCVLGVRLEADRPVFVRSGPVPGAEALRADWENLSAIDRRRFLALDRTDLAEERTLLAYHRTLMAKSRTGMALGRTGVALAGIGIALVRTFHHGHWDMVGWSLMAVGVLMALEGLYWYFPGRRAGGESTAAARKAEGGESPWGLVLPPEAPEAEAKGRHRVMPRSLPPGPPGIWGTTGLALERTLLAERRNVMARLRTYMARARTGLSFIRTGMNFSAVGLGLLVSFGLRNPVWSVLEIAILCLGVLLVADGLYWFLPADRLRRSLPFCSHAMEIWLPDYSRPTAQWPKAVFEND